MQDNQLKELVEELSKEFPVAVPDIDRERLTQHLRDRLDHLINSDFNGLISLLYRLDIPEEKLRQTLNQSPDIPTSTIITDLIIERQLQKIETRKTFKKDIDIPGDERW